MNRATHAQNVAASRNELCLLAQIHYHQFNLRHFQVGQMAIWIINHSLQGLDQHINAVNPLLGVPQITVTLLHLTISIQQTTSRSRAQWRNWRDVAMQFLVDSFIHQNDQIWVIAQSLVQRKSSPQTPLVQHVVFIGAQ